MPLQSATGNQSRCLMCLTTLDMALSEWEDNETKCFEYLYRTLFVALTNGKPYKVLMLEYVLGGCGAELRPEFLERLAPLLKQFHIAVIADEVLTGARVGPTMTMTTSQPTAFKECVEVITMGKFLNCTIVIRKKPNKPIEVEEPIHGTSTHLDCSHACWIFISATTNQRLIPDRRKQVLHKFGFEGKADTELHWGRGLLIFTNMSRPQLTRGLKNRLLPMIENTKIRKSRCVATTWTRSSVVKVVKKKVEDWLCMQEKNASSSLSTFQVSLVEYILAKTRLVTMTEDSFVFHQDQVWEFIGLASATEKADVMRIALALKGVSTKKKPKAFLHAAILKAIANTKSTHGVFKKRVGNRRTEYVHVSAEYFLHWNCNMTGVKCNPPQPCVLMTGKIGGPDVFATVQMLNKCQLIDRLVYYPLTVYASMLELGPIRKLTSKVIFIYRLA